MRQGKTASAQWREAREGQQNFEAMRELELHIKPPDVKSRLLVKCDNRPETANMKISRPNDNAVSVTVATRFTAGGAIRIAHYDVIDDGITLKL